MDLNPERARKTARKDSSLVKETDESPNVSYQLGYATASCRPERTMDKVGIVTSRVAEQETDEAPSSLVLNGSNLVYSIQTTADGDQALVTGTKNWPLASVGVNIGASDGEWAFGDLSMAMSASNDNLPLKFSGNMGASDGEWAFAGTDPISLRSNDSWTMESMMAVEGE